MGFPSVFSQMCEKIPLLHRLEHALIAMEEMRLCFFRVLILQVDHIGPRLDARIVTVLAFVRLLSGMYELMPTETIMVCRLVITLPTRIRFFSSVQSQVKFQT